MTTYRGPRDEYPPFTVDSEEFYMERHRGLHDGPLLPNLQGNMNMNRKLLEKIRGTLAEMRAMGTKTVEEDLRGAGDEMLCAIDNRSLSSMFASIVRAGEAFGQKLLADEYASMLEMAISDVDALLKESTDASPDDTSKVDDKAGEGGSVNV